MRGARGGGTKSQVIWSVCCFFKSLQPEPQQGERSCRFSCAHNPTWKYFTPRAQIQLDKWSKSENLKNLRPNSTATTNAMVPLSRLCQSYGPQQHIWLLLILHFSRKKTLLWSKVYVQPLINEMLFKANLQGRLMSALGTFHNSRLVLESWHEHIASR